MSSVNFCMPDGNTYLGFKVPRGCSLAQWKSFLELGGTGDKVLYARKLACHCDREKKAALLDSADLSAHAAPIFVSGPGSVVSMLDLALKKELAWAVPPGRLLTCASPGCNLLVYSKPTFGGYCCVQCCRGAGHGVQCEGRQAPEGTPKAEPAWKPEDPHGKYQKSALTQEELLADEMGWAPPTGEEKALQKSMMQRTNIFIGPYLDYEEVSAAECIALFKSAEHGWSLDYDANFLCELLHEGFYTRGLELALQQPPVQLLVISWDRKLSIWDFTDVHLSRQVRKRAKRFTLTMDAAFDEVLLGCVRMHGENWMFRGWRCMARKLRSEGYTGKLDIQVSIHSFELWDEESKLVAGDIGSFVGTVYTSMSGFHEQHSRSAGEVQMLLMASLLHQLGLEWIDLGQVLPYKEFLGAKVVGRREYLERLHRDRDKKLPANSLDLSGHFKGSDLLAHLCSLVDATADRETGERKRRSTSKYERKKSQVPESARQRGKGPHQLEQEEGPAAEPVRSGVDRGQVWEAAAALAARQLASCPRPSAPSQPHFWVVVGGKDKGGIVVRTGASVTSAALPTRLATGAKVREVKLVGNRLNFQKAEGEGPDTGWVSIRYEDRPLLELCQS